MKALVSMDRKHGIRWDEVEELKQKQLHTLSITGSSNQYAVGFKIIFSSCRE